jgi:DNA invertase Pin-like site-specific DNA recombinase
MLMLQMMGAFSQFGRSMIRKRQAEGIAAAKAKGKDRSYKGRKQSIDRKVVMKILDAGEGITAVARALGVSRQRIYRIKNELPV